MFEEDVYEYKGYKLIQEEDREPDCRKIFHDVRLPNGDRTSIKWTPYGLVSQADFRVIIDMGLLPVMTQHRETPGGSHNWDAESFHEFVATLAPNQP